MLEAKYLKKTIAPNIRFKRKIEKKFVNFTIEEIKSQIRDIIKHQTHDTSDLDINIPES